MHKIICSAILVVILYSLGFPGDDTSNKLINIARLPIARVSASSYNTTPFSIRDAFDGDIPLGNGNYPAWWAKAHQKDDIYEWVNIRFLGPVTVYTLRIIGEKVQIDAKLPAELSIKNASFVMTSVDPEGKEETEKIGPLEFQNDIVSLSLPKLYKNVKNIKINLVAANYGPIAVREIEVLGLAPNIKNKSPLTPKIDGFIEEKYWNDLGLMSYYELPPNLPQRRFIVTEEKAMLVDNTNTIVKVFSLVAKNEETKLKNNVFAIKSWSQNAEISKDKKYLLIDKHLWEWEEDRDSFFHKNIGEYVEAGDPGTVVVEVYDLMGNKVIEKPIKEPMDYTHYCVNESSQTLDVVTCYRD